MIDVKPLLKATVTRATGSTHVHGGALWMPYITPDRNRFQTVPGAYVYMVLPSFFHNMN